MSKYKNVLEKYNNYSEYKKFLDSIKEFKKYDMVLFDKILNYNYDLFIKFIKLLFLPFGILFIIYTGAKIIDSSFHTHFSNSLEDIMSQNEMALNYILVLTILVAIIIFVNMVYNFRKEYILFKYTIYFSLFSFVIGSLKINNILTNLIFLIAFILNIFVYIKYKKSLNIINLPKNTSLLCKRKDGIKKMKISKYDDYVSVNLYNYKEEFFQIIKNWKYFLIGIVMLFGIAIISEEQKFNVLMFLHLLTYLLTGYFLVITFYLFQDIINYVKTIRNEIEYCKDQK